MAKSKAKTTVGLKCTETGRINYTVKKEKRQNQSKLELMKYSPSVRKHTLHREIKLK